MSLSPKVLLVGPTFFGYRSAIAGELRDLGYEVKEADDRPSESIAFKSLGRVSYRLVDSEISKYAVSFKRGLVEGGFSLVVFLGGMSFCFLPGQFSDFRECTDARFVGYLWDALDNCQRFGECAGMFDEVYSFEPRDCASHGFKLLPLFYSRQHADVPISPNGGFQYDACFVGSVHQPSKFKAVSGICRALRECGLRTFEYYYMPSRSVELIRRLTRRSVYAGHRFRHVPLTSEQVAEVLSKSKTVIDAPQAGQTGLTIRTLEALGTRRKLITTNADIRKYDFFGYGDVAVWDEIADSPRAFFDRPFQSLPEKVYGSYSIDSFVGTLLGRVNVFAGYETKEDSL